MTSQSKFLFTWELTDGLRCLQLVRPLIAELVRRGFSVAFAARRVPAAYNVMGLSQIPVLQAPVFTGLPPARKGDNGFQHWLLEAGWADGDWLLAAADAWRNLIQLVNPTALVLVESPTALLASRGLPVKRVMLLTSTFCPWRLPWGSRIGGEDCLTHVPDELSNANCALKRLGAPAIAKATCLKEDVLRCFSPLVSELAPLDQDVSVEWSGPWSDDLGSRPNWHQGNGSRLYVQIRPFNLYFALLAAVRQINHPTLVQAPFVTGDMRRHLASDSFRFVDVDISIRQALATCRLCITTDETTLVDSLHAGTPCLFVPDGNDVAPVAQRAIAIGAATLLPIDLPNEFAGLIRRLLEGESHLASAKAFAARWRNVDSASNAGRIVDKIERITG